MEPARPLILALALMVALASGCLDDAGGALDEADGPGPRETTASPDVDDPGSGTAAQHGEPTVEESSVETELGQDGRWHARKTVTISNDFGGASRADVGITFSAGDLRVAPDSNGGYQYVVVLDMAAGTEQEARDGLDEVVVDHEDRLDDGTLRLATEVTQPPVQQVVPGVNVGGLFTRQLRVDFDAHVAPGASYDMSLDTSSADIAVQDIGGSSLATDSSSGDVRLERIGTDAIGADTSSGDITIHDSVADVVGLDSSSGDIHFDGEAGSLVADASSGDIDVDAKVDRLNVDTSSGGVSLDVEPTRSGAYTIGTSSGDVDVTLATGSALGYDITASVSSGDIDIDVADTEVLVDEEDDKRVRTLGYTSRAVQTGFNIGTSSGDITIEG